MKGMDLMIQAAINKLLENPEIKERLVPGLQIIVNVGAQLDRIEAQNAEILSILKREFGDGQHDGAIPKLEFNRNGGTATEPGTGGDAEAGNSGRRDGTLA